MTEVISSSPRADGLTSSAASVGIMSIWHFYSVVCGCYNKKLFSGGSRLQCWAVLLFAVYSVI